MGQTFGAKRVGLQKKAFKKKKKISDIREENEMRNNFPRENVQRKPEKKERGNLGVYPTLSKWRERE